MLPYLIRTDMTSPLSKLLNQNIIDSFDELNITIQPPLLIKEIDINGMPTSIGIMYKKPTKGINSQNKFLSHVISSFKEKEEQCNELFIELMNAYQIFDEYEIAHELSNYINDVCFDVDDISHDIHSILQHKAIIKEFEVLDNINDYPEVFPLACDKKRKIIAYLGDTNSGKTWNAMAKIADSSTSAYMAPLRLLAHETYEYLNQQCIPTSLVTGEERIETKDSMCTSSTVECFDPSREYDTVVIDEIQMIDDIDRGAFFVQALVGSNAKEIIVTGPKEYANKLKNIADYLGDEFEVEYFERKSELKSLKKPVKLKDIKPNTAIVAFSKKEVYLIQDKLPKHLKSTVLYGALGYDVRQTQAERFRNGEVDVIVTTDCIGMGLNLPIETVLFTAIEKYDGHAVKPLSTMLTKQICGRAGRFGKFDTGYYGAIDSHKNGFVKQQMTKSLKPKKGKLPVLPPKRYIETLLRVYDITEILNSWQKYVTFKREDSIFEPANMSKQIEIASYLQDNYSDYKKYWGIIYCPVDMDKQFEEFNQIVQELFKKDKITLPKPNVSFMGQNALEYFLKELTIFQWFLNKYPHTFVKDAEIKIQDMIDECNYHLNMYLKRG